MERKNLKDYQKLVDALAPHKYQCKICGRKEYIGVKRDRALCSHCGHYIYKSEALEFKYKVEEALRKI